MTGKAYSYLLGSDMSTDKEKGLHGNDGGTHVNAHDFTPVDFTVKTK